jgi:hypothetical protein
MQIPGAAVGSSTWALGEALLAQGAVLGGTAGVAEQTVGGALINGFDDSQAGALTGLGTVVGAARAHGAPQ